MSQLTKKNVSIDVRKLENYLQFQVPNTDVKRVLRKIVIHMKVENLHSVARSVDYMSAEPSDLGIVECLKIWNEFVKSGTNTRHPVYIVDNLVANGDVEFTPSAIVGNVKQDDPSSAVKFVSKMGVFCEDDGDREKAITATMLASSTSHADKGIVNIYSDTRKLEFFGMVPVDLRQARGMFNETTKSGTLARDEIYSSLKANEHDANLIIDMAYSDLFVGEVNKEAIAYIKRILEVKNKQRIKKGGGPLTYIPRGKRPASYKDDYKIKLTEEDFTYVCIASNILSQTVGESEKGRGALSSIFYFGEISASWHKVIARYNEIMSLLKTFKLNVVRLPTSKAYGMNLIRTLINNGVTVISDTGRGTHVAVDKKTGHYMYTTGDYLDIINSPFQSPIFKKTMIEWGDEKVFDSHLASMQYKSSSIRACLAKMTPFHFKAYKRGDITLLPSISAASLKMWVVSTPGPVEDGYLGTNISRMMLMIYLKGRFPFSRYPGYFSDPYAHVFSFTCLIPKVDRKIRTLITEKKMFESTRTVIHTIDSEVYGKQVQEVITELTSDDVAKLRLNALRMKDNVQAQVLFWVSCLNNEQDEVLEIMRNDLLVKKIDAVYKDYDGNQHNYIEGVPQVYAGADDDEDDDDIDLDKYQEAFSSARGKIVDGGSLALKNKK